MGVGLLTITRGRFPLLHGSCFGREVLNSYVHSSRPLFTLKTIAKESVVSDIMSDLLASMQGISERSEDFSAGCNALPGLLLDQGGSGDAPCTAGSLASFVLGCGPSTLYHEGSNGECVSADEFCDSALSDASRLEKHAGLSRSWVVCRSPKEVG